MSGGDDDWPQHLVHPRCGSCCMRLVISVKVVDEWRWTHATRTAVVVIWCDDSDWKPLLNRVYAVDLRDFGLDRLPETCYRAKLTNISIWSFQMTDDSRMVRRLPRCRIRTAWPIDVRVSQILPQMETAADYSDCGRSTYKTTTPDDVGLGVVWHCNHCPSLECSALIEAHTITDKCYVWCGDSKL